MKTYQILNENDILQKGDEFLSRLMPLAWSLSTQIGEKASGILYRRLVSDTTPTSADLDSDRTELLSQSSDLKHQIKNLQDELLHWGQVTSFVSRNNLGNPGDYVPPIVLRTLEQNAAVIEDKNATVRRLREKLENIDAPTVEYVEHLTARLAEFEVVVKTLLADTQFYRRVIDKLTQNGPEEV